MVNIGEMTDLLEAQTPATIDAADNLLGITRRFASELMVVRFIFFFVAAILK